MTVQTKMTATEFLALPESNLPHELINGEEIMSPSPTAKHQRPLYRLFDLVRRLVPNGEAFMAPMDVYLDEGSVVQPDLMWIAEGSTCVLDEDKYLHGGPDLVAEVLSPSTTRFDRKDKFRLYEKHGVREYWIVDPDAKLIEVWHRVDAKFVRLDIYAPGDQFSSPLLGTVEAKEIFPE